jgi:hypothetical protein
MFPGAAARLAVLGGGIRCCGESEWPTEDGTATHTLTILFQRAGIGDVDARRLERQIEAAEERALANGYTARRIETSTTTGLRVSGTTRDVLDTGSALNGIYNSVVRDATGPIAPFSGSFDRESSAIGGTEFVLDLTVDTDLLFRSVQEMGPGNRQLATREGVEEVVTFSYTASMPGQLRTTDGAIVGEGVTRWTIPLDSTATMRASSNVGRDSPWALIALVTVGALLIVAAVSSAIAWLLLRRHRRGRSTIPLVAPITAAGTEITATSSPQPVTVQDVGSSIVRAMEQVITGTDANEAMMDTDSPAEDETEPLHGA